MCKPIQNWLYQLIIYNLHIPIISKIAPDGTTWFNKLLEKKSSKVSPKDCTDEADCNVDNVDPVGDEKQQSEKSETDL